MQFAIVAENEISLGKKTLEKEFDQIPFYFFVGKKGC